MILIDTNIIVFAHNADSPHQQKANQLIEDVLNLKFEACISHQNLLEFFSIVTNSRRVEKPLSSQEAFFLIETYLSSSRIIKIYPSIKTFSHTISLSQKLSLAKAEIFDCYLVATMLENNVFTIYTENTAHFKCYKNIKVINPF